MLCFPHGFRSSFNLFCQSSRFNITEILKMNRELKTNAWFNWLNLCFLRVRNFLRVFERDGWLFLMPVQFMPPDNSFCARCTTIMLQIWLTGFSLH